MRKMLLALFILSIAAGLFAARKALVIGNSAYTDKPLKNTINDAKDIAGTLEKLDFKVTKLYNASLEEMYRVIYEFCQTLDTNDEAVFYYAGHGAQEDGENYLIPVSPPILDRFALISNTYKCSELLRRFERPKVAIIFLDACRNNPFSWSRSFTRGLAIMQVPLKSQCVVFSTSAGAEAYDGDEEERNSPFAKALLKYLPEPYDFDELMRKVRREVGDATDDKQDPFKMGDLREEYFFTKQELITPFSPVPIPVAIAPPLVIENKTAEEVVVIPKPVVTVKPVDMGSLEIFSNVAGKIYLDDSDVAFGTIDKNTRMEIQSLKVGNCKVTFKSTKQQETKDVSIDKNKVSTLTFSFAEPITKPGFIQISGAEFMMGSKNGDEKPIHKVSLAPYQIAVYELRVSEFNTFVSATKYKTTAEITGGAFIIDAVKNKWRSEKTANWKKPGFGITNNQPVTCISWYDAISYCNWRSENEGLKPCYSVRGNTKPKDWGLGLIICDTKANGYRLPTEAEWEFAARAGNPDNQFSGSNDLMEVGVNFDNNKGMPSEVGSLQPNEFGLYDMTGNVSEWCWDWYSSGYYKKSSELNPVGPTLGTHKLARGGAWYDKADRSKVSYRYYKEPDYCEVGLGFRLVKSVKQ